MKKKSYLKARNWMLLFPFLAGNVLIFLYIVYGDKLLKILAHTFDTPFSLRDKIVSVSTLLVTIILSGIFSSNVKARLVFWRWHDPLPGSRIFSELMKKDSRIDRNSLEKIHGKLPIEPKAQNTLWYKIYLKHREVVSICGAHKEFLLTRDMTALSAIFAMLFPIGSLLLHVGMQSALIYFSVLVIQYLALSQVARNYGRRFALTVLAEESHSRQP